MHGSQYRCALRFWCDQKAVWNPLCCPMYIVSCVWYLLKHKCIIEMLEWLHGVLHVSILIQRIRTCTFLCIPPLIISKRHTNSNLQDDEWSQICGLWFVKLNINCRRRYILYFDSKWKPQQNKKKSMKRISGTYAPGPCHVHVMVSWKKNNTVLLDRV